MLVHSLLLLALTAAVRLCARQGGGVRRACGARAAASKVYCCSLETTEAVAQLGLGGCRADAACAPPLPLLYASLQLDLFPALFNVAHRQAVVPFL